MASRKPSGLGRGLGALLGDDALKTETSGCTQLPISQVESCSSQPRKYFDEIALTELADSIREHGIIQPLTVRKLSSGYYQIITGERRWRAARMAGLQEVPVLIMDADDQTAALLTMIENLQREDLSPIEEATGFQALIENYHMTQEEAARRVGKSRSAVTNSLRLLSLAPHVREKVEAGVLSAGHARTLLSLSPELQEQAAELVLSKELSVRQTEALVKRLSATEMNQEQEQAQALKQEIGQEISPELGQALGKQKHAEVDYAEAAQRELSSKLGRGVKIISGRKKGRIELEYYDIDDLNDLLDALSLLQIRKTGPQSINSINSFGSGKEQES